MVLTPEQERSIDKHFNPDSPFKKFADVMQVLLVTIVVIVFGGWKLWLALLVMLACTNILFGWP